MIRKHIRLSGSSGQQNILIYLRGVRHADLVSVLEFMYCGSVNVAQEELNSFLAVAEDLRVKGLTQNTQEKSKSRSPPPRDAVPPPKRPRPALPTPAQTRTLQQVYRPQEEREEEVQEVQEVQTVKQEQQSYQENQESAVALEDTYQDDYGDYGQYEGQYEGIDPNTGLPLADGNKETLIRSKMVKMSEGGLWACSDCSHTSSQAAGMRNHVESHHIGGTGYHCGVCNRFCRTKNALDTHRSRYKHF